MHMRLILGLGGCRFLGQRENLGGQRVGVLA